MKHERLDRLAAEIRHRNLDSLLIGKQSNVRYLSDFTGDYGFIAIGSEESRFITSPLYKEQALDEIGDTIEIVEVKNGLFDLLLTFGRSFWGSRIGFESEATTYGAFERFKQSFEFYDLVSVRNVVETLRMVKTPDEIDAVTRAQRISEKVFDDILGLVREGVTESDLACEIDYRFRKEGGERSSFDTIVAFGENTSKPHARPSGRALIKGDIVLFDMGTVVEGYASDMTRTVLFGKADDTFSSVYDSVLDAQTAAIESIRSGVVCSDVDRIARNVIEQAGYGDKFIHSLGHGVGLEVHESPRISAKDDTAMKSGMILTVEPGIYIPGWGGVRIEDMIVVEENHCKNLTRTTKDLIEL